MLKPYEVVKDPGAIPAREEELLAFWREQTIFLKSLAGTAQGTPWVFYEGPPTANGKPHAGHVITRAVKDLLPRFRTMQGFYVARKAGWDTHGLPVEIEVEKAEGLFDHNAIEEYGMTRFIEKCRESVWKYVDAWVELTERMAYWIDLDHPYVTYQNTYIESLWWIISQVNRAGLLYLGHKVVPFCWRCGSPLSSHEVAQNYKDVQDPSLTVAFRKQGTVDEFLLAWTTTPWTLPSNMALAVGPSIEYVTVKLDDGSLVTLAEARAEAVLGERYPPEAIVGRMNGEALMGQRYEPLYAVPEIASDPARAHFVVAADFVSTEDGTGIVHIAPGYGEDDHKVGLQYGIPLVQRVAGDGHFTTESPEFLRGLYFKDADKAVIKDLKERGQVFAQVTYQHNYPYCYRHDVPLIYMATQTWFIRTTAIKELLVEANKTIAWVPETIGTGRFGNFLEHNVDWALSRNRFWGTPLPIWVGKAEDGHEVVRVVGSLKELEQLTTSDLSTLDLHRPCIDEITFIDPDHGCLMKRVDQVADCWFDSGSMPVGQAEWPRLKTESGDMVTGYPSEFICEAVDQTRGWFYTLHAVACLLHHVAGKFPEDPDLKPFRNSPISYKQCLVLGHVLDKDGLKMSKSKGNVVDSMEVIEEFGADAMRWYFYASTDPWTPQRYYKEGVRDANRQFLLTLRNVAAFFGTYAQIDGYDPSNASQRVEGTEELDRWILSRLQGTIQTVTERLEAIDLLPAAQALDQFVDHLSNWWLRRNRDRFWQAEKNDHKWAAYTTLHHCLVTLSRLLAPFTPFIAEELHQTLVRPFEASAPESVHLLTWPAPDASRVDAGLELEMAVVLQAVQLGRAARKSHQLKTRQPLPRMEVIVSRDDQASAITAHAGVIAEELNVELVEIARDPAEYVSFTAKANFPALGPRFGKRMKQVAEAIGAVDPAVVQELALGRETFVITLPEGPETITRSEIELRIEERSGFAAEMAGGLGVVLDTTLTPALVAKGYAREVVHQIADMRKEGKLEYQERIYTVVVANGEVAEALATHADYVKRETLTAELLVVPSAGGSSSTAAEFLGRIRANGKGQMSAAMEEAFAQFMGHITEGEIDGNPVVVAIQPTER